MHPTDQHGGLTLPVRGPKLSSGRVHQSEFFSIRDKEDRVRALWRGEDESRADGRPCGEDFHLCRSSKVRLCCGSLEIARRTGGNEAAYAFFQRRSRVSCERGTAGNTGVQELFEGVSWCTDSIVESRSFPREIVVIVGGAFARVHPCHCCELLAVLIHCKCNRAQV